MNKVIGGICTFVELGCILTLAGITLKRTNDCYKAECELAKANINLACSEIGGILKDARIRTLEQELEELKTKNENGEEA